MLPTSAAIVAELRHGTVEYCVLAHLRGGSASGREIARALGSPADGEWDEQDGHGLFDGEPDVHPLLARLNRRGWVSTTWGEASDGRPARLYGLTATGASALACFTSVWSDFADRVSRAVAS